MPRKTIPIFWITFLVLSTLVAACNSKPAQQEAATYELAPLASMPLDVQNAPEVVRTSYQFAVANPEILTQLPCYCGCGGMGHTSNYSCYVSEQNPDGSVMFDDHALGCSICVDITRDAMRMLDDGKTIPVIQSYINQTYSAFGPSNMP